MATTKSSETLKPLFPWKVRFTLFLLSVLWDASRRPNGIISRRLLNFFDLKTQPSLNPINGVKSSDVTVDSTRNLWFRLFIPTASTSSTSLPVILYFHGGGFSFMSAASSVYDDVCRRFSRTIPSIVVSVNYRLSPEHRLPSQYDDGFDVLKFLDENHGALPEIADVSRCFLAGDSAGGNLAHHVAIRVSRERLRKVNVIGLIPIQPFFGGEERTESDIGLDGFSVISLERTDWWWKVFLPEGSDRDHEAVNVSGPNAEDITGIDYPDALVIVGGFDPLKDWQKRYHEWLGKSGKKAKLIEYPNMVHAFYLFPELPPASEMISEVKDFVHRRVSNVK